MKKLFLLLAATAMSLPFTIARADVLTLTSVADSTVDALNPTASEGAGHLRGEMVGTVDQPAENLTFFYMQFQMPTGTTGQDIGTINSIDLKFRRASAAPALSLTYYVYGVFEGVDSQNVNDYTWNDGVGFDPSHTLVKFLNPDNEEIFYYSDPAESGFVGFIDTASEGPPLRQFGFFPIQADFATQNLQNLLLDDTDGKITFYAKVRQNFGVTPLQQIASIDDGESVAPQLIVDFNAAPDVLLGDYNFDEKVDGEDLTVWTGAYGMTGPELAADGDTDEDVDGADFLTWQRNVGLPTAGATAAPEPATAFLALASLACLWRRRGRHAPRG